MGESETKIKTIRALLSADDGDQINFCNVNGNNNNVNNGDDSDDDNNFDVSGGPDQLLQ